MANLADKKCIPCEGDVLPLLPEDAQVLLDEINAGIPEDDAWILIDDAHLLAKSLHFKNFKQVMAFTNEVARLAEEEGHHPDLSLSYDTLGIELTTHAIGGLSENDFILAAKINKIKK